MASSADYGYPADSNPVIDPVRPIQVDLPPDSSPQDYEEQEDGSVVVHTGEEDPEHGDTEFDANLAETLAEADLSAIAIDLLDAVERDWAARKRRDDLYAQGLRATGLSDDTTAGGAELFDGASDVVHPMIVEGCIDFAARAMKELFPPSGPCKTKIIGDADDEKLDRADRKKQYMNWQLTKQIKEYRSEMERLLSQVPMGGSMYLKMWRSAAKKRPVCEFIPIDDFAMPYASSGLMSTQRATQRIRLTEQKFDQRVRDGTYRTTEYGAAPSSLDDQTTTGEVADAISGIDSSELYDEDGLRTVYEIQVDYAVTGDEHTGGDIAPYIITIDEPSRKVCAIRRNWEEDDEQLERLTWVVEFPFIPWRGPYALGFPHIVGGLGAAATGALRALLDSAHINNAPTGLRAKGVGISGKTIQPEIGEFAEIVLPPNTTDIRQVVMPLPFNPPSQVLFDLMTFSVDAGKSVIGTAEESIKDATSDMPVGTALALIEQGSITYSAVHARLHAAQAQVLDILHRLNAKYLDDQETVEELGALVVGRADFQGPSDIIPVSDPNIFSEAQRYAQLQAVLDLAAKFPEQYKPDALNARALKLLNFPDAEDVLNSPPQAQRIDEPYKENSLAAQGDPVMAYNGQNHLEHLQQHLQFATSPMFGGNPLVGALAVAPLLKHCTQHLIMLYEEEAKASIGAAQDMNNAMPYLNIQANHGLALAMTKMAHELAPIMPMLQQAQQMVQKLSAPPPPSDPAYLVGMAEVQRKAAADQAQQAADAARDQRQAQVESDALSLEQQQKNQQMVADMVTTHIQGVHSLIAEKMDNATQVLLQELRNSGAFDQNLATELIRASDVTDPVTTEPNAPPVPQPAAPQAQQQLQPPQPPLNPQVPALLQPPQGVTNGVAQEPQSA